MRRTISITLLILVILSTFTVAYAKEVGREAGFCGEIGLDVGDRKAISYNDSKKWSFEDIAPDDDNLIAVHLSFEDSEYGTPVLVTLRDVDDDKYCKTWAGRIGVDNPTMTIWFYANSEKTSNYILEVKHIGRGCPNFTVKPLVVNYNFHQVFIDDKVIDKSKK